MRREHLSAAVPSHICVAEVVGEREYDMGTWCFCGGDDDDESIDDDEHVQTNESGPPARGCVVFQCVSHRAQKSDAKVGVQ